MNTMKNFNVFQWLEDHGYIWLYWNALTQRGRETVYFKGLPNGFIRRVTIPANTGRIQVKDTPL